MECANSQTRYMVHLVVSSCSRGLAFRTDLDKRPLVKQAQARSRCGAARRTRVASPVMCAQQKTQAAEPDDKKREMLTGSEQSYVSKLCFKSQRKNCATTSKRVAQSNWKWMLLEMDAKRCFAKRCFANRCPNRCCSHLPLHSGLPLSSLLALSHHHRSALCS